MSRLAAVVLGAVIAVGLVINFLLFMGPIEKPITPTPIGPLCDPSASPGPDPDCPIPTRSVVSGQTWIGVYPPLEGWDMPQTLSLEVGGEAWRLPAPTGWGVVSMTLSDPKPVTLLGVDDCHQYAAFDVAPGGLYVIRFAEDHSTSVEQAEFIDSGPALAEPAALTGC